MVVIRRFVRSEPSVVREEWQWQYQYSSSSLPLMEEAEVYVHHSSAANTPESCHKPSGRLCHPPTWRFVETSLSSSSSCRSLSGKQCVSCRGGVYFCTSASVERLNGWSSVPSSYTPSPVPHRPWNHMYLPTYAPQGKGLKLPPLLLRPLVSAATS